ncbi:MAG: ribosome maturation factor RimP [Burkholderiales bacterium]|nr:ribosome maturation factor RimP [Burkholderiales bacterium]
MDLRALLETTLPGLGYELVDLEISNRGSLVRVFIDKPEGISIEDCTAVSNHLSRVFAVENVEYDRLEVSSPGMDRPLNKESDFVRFVGHRARIKMRSPIDGRKIFSGVLGAMHEGVFQLLVDEKQVLLNLADVDKARLIPEFD